MAEKTTERTYLGPATRLREREGGPVIAGKGDKVKFTDAQYAAMTRGGHQFDPPWTGPAAPAPQDVPPAGDDGKQADIPG